MHDIYGYFGTAQSTTSQKSKAIRDLLKLSYFDNQFTTASSQKHNPFNDMVLVNGLIVPKDLLD